MILLFCNPGKVPPVVLPKRDSISKISEVNHTQTYLHMQWRSSFSSLHIYCLHVDNSDCSLSVLWHSSLVKCGGSWKMPRSTQTCSLKAASLLSYRLKLQRISPAAKRVYWEWNALQAALIRQPGKLAQLGSQLNSSRRHID